MGYHPHIHYIVPAVGLNTDEELKQLKNPQWLLPAQPLAARLRTLLANALLESELIDSQLFRELVKMDWNVSVDLAGSGENAVKYLGNYVQRSVISDQRILAIAGDKVRIAVKNRSTGKYEPRSMTGVEFNPPLPAARLAERIPPHTLPWLPACPGQVQAAVAANAFRCSHLQSIQTVDAQPLRLYLSSLRNCYAAGQKSCACTPGTAK